MSSGNDSLALTEVGNDLMTLSEVAERARVKISTLRAWRLMRRNLPFVKLAGKVLVRKRDLEAFIEAAVDEPHPRVPKSKRPA
jgi:excisionase family DNA binding protein